MSSGDSNESTLGLQLLTQVHPIRMVSARFRQFYSTSHRIFPTILVPGVVTLHIFTLHTIYLILFLVLT
jgi:hypothetical protein